MDQPENSKSIFRDRKTKRIICFSSSCNPTFYFINFAKDAL